MSDTTTKSIVFHCKETEKNSGIYEGRDADLLTWCQSRPQKFSHFILGLIRQAKTIEESGGQAHQANIHIDEAAIKPLIRLIIDQFLHALTIQGDIQLPSPSISGGNEGGGEVDNEDLEAAFAGFFNT